MRYCQLWSEDDQRELRKLVHEGKLSSEIAALLNRSPSAVQHKCRALGMHSNRPVKPIRKQALRNRNYWSDDDTRTLLQLVEQDTPMIEISRRLHRSMESVRCRLVRCTEKSERPAKRPWSMQEFDLAYELRGQGYPYKEIAVRLNRPWEAIYRKLTRTIVEEDTKKFNHDYSAEDDDLLREDWANVNVRELAKTIGRSEASVRVRAGKLGLKRQNPVESGEWVYSRAQLISMNARFCSAMTAAIDRGLEQRPTEVCTIPGTRSPTRKEIAPALPIGRSVAGECADA